MGGLPCQLPPLTKMQETTMRVWAIKHKPTNTWMPSRIGRSGRGWSHWNPGYVSPELGPEKYYDTNPRIFFTVQSVRNALTAWLQGAWERGTLQEGDWETGYYTVDGDPEPKAPPVPRCREDMEIVELELVGA